MADPFSILVANLNALGFFGFLLPWIFMFAVTYGLLAKAKFFEDTKIVGVISLVLAFFVVGFGGPWLAGFFVNLFGYAAIIIAGLLVIVLFITMSGGSIGKFFDNKGVAAILVGIGIIVFFIAMGGFSVVVSDAVIGIIFIIIIMAIAVYFIAGNSK
ncbi:MAG: hypothetical protein QT00_C0002G0362 [archaeon GW2011_AR5]|nr:MAG: hypothetical protein QT00_C0002G0362 [archaeon GW2011_AR5]